MVFYRDALSFRQPGGGTRAVYRTKRRGGFNSLFCLFCTFTFQISSHSLYSSPFVTIHSKRVTTTLLIHRQVATPQFVIFSLVRMSSFHEFKGYLLKVQQYQIPQISSLSCTKRHAGGYDSYLVPVVLALSPVATGPPPKVLVGLSWNDQEDPSAESRKQVPPLLYVYVGEATLYTDPTALGSE